MDTRQNAQPLASFRKILQLEHERGFDNKAVTTGLDEFLARWKPQLRPHLSKTAEANNLLDRPYSRMTPNQRAKWVETCLTLLDSSGSPTPSTNAKPKRAPSPPINRPFVPKIPLPKSPPPPDPDALHNPVTNLKGVDTKTAEKLARLHVNTVRDLLYHFPRYHREYSHRTKISRLKNWRRHNRLCHRLASLACHARPQRSRRHPRPCI